MKPAPFDVTAAQRWFAVELNNLAWELYEQSSRTEADIEEMLHAAHAAAIHWTAVGTPLNTLRALQLLAAVHLAAGQSENAKRYAQKALMLDDVADQNPFDRAVTHILAAITYSPDATLAHVHRTKANSFLEKLEDRADVEQFHKLFDAYLPSSW